MKLCGYMAHLFLKDFTKILDFSKNLVRAFFSHPMGFPKWFTLNLETSYLGENSEISEFLKKAKFSIGLTLKCVIRMTLVRPIFHTEFDAPHSTSFIKEVWRNSAIWIWRYWRFLLATLSIFSQIARF